jgi:hypothetical protein
MRIVVALGGNSLLKQGELMNHDVQRANIRVAAQALLQGGTFFAADENLCAPTGEMAALTSNIFVRREN